MGVSRKGQRLAQKNNVQAEKNRSKEALIRQQLSSSNRAYSELFSNEEDRYKYLESLLKRHNSGEYLTPREIDILCSGMSSEEQMNYSICDGIRFTRLHRDYIFAKQNHYSLSEEEQIQIDEFLNKWEIEIWDNRDDNDRVYIELRKETRLTIKSMKRFYSDKKLTPNELELKENEIILRSKNIYIKVKRIMENLGKNALIMNMGNEEVHIDEFTLIHSFFRHFSELTKQYDDNKSYFSPEFPIEELPKLLSEKILEPINTDGTLKNPLPKSIFFKYFGRLYRLYFEDKFVNNGHNTVKRVNTFYPAEQRKDTEASKKYHFKKINKNLYIGVEKQLF